MNLSFRLYAFALTVVALSGYLPLNARTLQLESHIANQRLPIFLGHGEHDEVGPRGGRARVGEPVGARRHEEARAERPPHLGARRRAKITRAGRRRP